MKKVRNHHAALNLPTLRLEGALFLPDQLEKAALGQAKHQSESDYHTPRGLKLKDDYSRSFQIACAQWKHFASQFDRKDISPIPLTQRFVQDLLRDSFGYTNLLPAQPITIGDRTYPVTFLAGSFPVVVAPFTLDLDDADTTFAIAGSGSKKKSAFQLAQELLNASANHQWALVSNGRQLRLLRDAATLTRPSYLEVDLQDLLAGTRFAEFASVWRLLHATRAGITPANQSGPVIWEAWRQTGQEEGTRVRDGLRLGVTQALLILGEGFLKHESNFTLRQKLHEGHLTKDGYFQELLRLVYRLIFLFSVEERAVLHTAEETSQATAARQAYAQGYAVSRLRDLCLKRRSKNRFDDQWQSLRIIFKSLATGEPKLALPALGGLFAPGQCPTLDASSIDNAHFMSAMQKLRWASLAGTLAPVDYRNMGPEELGSVYESLLELVPDIDLTARRFGFVGLSFEGSTAGNARKLSGSYYTPDSLVMQLIKSALDPVIEQRLQASPTDPVKTILAIKVIDPACGSGHFLLAAARRLAERLAQARAPEGVVKPQDYRHALREVISNCIFGVDRNPMALELARTALWLEGFEEGRPLSFLDHHLRPGDSLLGLIDLKTLEKGIAKDAFKALSGDSKAVCQALSKANTADLKILKKDLKAGQLSLSFDQTPGIEALKQLEAISSDTPADIAAKEARFTQFLKEARSGRLAQAANLAVGAYLLPKTADRENQIPTTATLFKTLAGHPPGPQEELKLQATQAACDFAQVFHWPLEFPQVFASGGFDCVLGNPPWEVSQMGEEEFFATRAPQIAELAGDTRKKAIEALSISDPQLWQAYVRQCQVIAAMNNFYRESGRFPLTACGKLNTYPLFAETIRQIVSPTGRAGFIVPTGIATDDTTKIFFGDLVNAQALVSYFGFKNERFLFPRPVEHTVTFGLLTIVGRALTSEKMQFCWFAWTVEEMNDPDRQIFLTRKDIEFLNPNTRTCPIFRTERDAEITKKIYRSIPVLIEEENPHGNPWEISFSQGLFNMTTSSHLFQGSPGEGVLPLYEAKLIHQFDHRWATYIDENESRKLTPAEKQDPNFNVTPRYWVPERDVLWRISKLPDFLLREWRDQDAGLMRLGLAQLLFADWLIKHKPDAIYPAWLAFIKHQPFARSITPTTLGLCGDNPDSIKPLNDNYLPAEPVDQITYGPREFTTWYACDPELVRKYIEMMQKHTSLVANCPTLITIKDAVNYVDQLVRETSPNWLMGWRDICRATDVRTLISSVLPRAGVGDKFLLMFPKASPSKVAALVGCLNSLPCDFIARQKVGGTAFKYFTMKQIAVLPPDRYSDEDLAFVVPRILELTYTTNDLTPWARDLGFEGPPFNFDPDRRAILRAELDAYYARLYGLTRDELRYILDPADVMGPDYPSETFRVLKNNDIKNFGEYRTGRLVLEAWDTQSNHP